MKRILLLSRGGQIGGSQRQSQLLTLSVDSEKYQFIVVCCSDGPFVPILRKQGIETHVFPLRHGESSQTSSAAAATP